MSIKLQDGVYTQAPKPGDEKTIVGVGRLFATKEEIITSYRYDGMPVYETGTGKSFRWNAGSGQWLEAIFSNTTDLVTNTSTAEGVTQTNVNDNFVLAIADNLVEIETNEANILINAAEIALRTKPMGNYTLGQEYNPYEQVLDQGYLAYALVFTDERPAPQKIGEATYIYDGTLTSFSANAKQVIVGQRYTTTTPVYLSEFSLETVEGGYYRIFSVADPETNPVINELLSFTSVTTGRRELAVDEILIKANSKFDIVSISAEPNATPTTWTGDWDYKTPNNDNTPGQGIINHANKNIGVLKINKWDSSVADRSAELGALGIGDTIEGAGMSWVIQSTNLNGNVYEFGISPSTQGNDGLATFTFGTVSATPIPYSRDDDYYDGHPNIQGLFGADLPYSSIVPDSNAYGIDIKVQDVVVSNHWFIQSGPGGSAGGGNNVDTSQFVDIPSAQTITGAKTFTQPILKQGLAIDTAYSSETIIATNKAVGGSIFELVYPHNTTPAQVYFPVNKGGTVALIEDLSNYVTLDGDQNITGVKRFQSVVYLEDVNLLAQNSTLQTRAIVDASGFLLRGYSAAQDQTEMTQGILSHKNGATSNTTLLRFATGGDGDYTLFIPYKGGESQTIATLDDITDAIGGDYVTVDTNQTITGAKTFTQAITVTQSSGDSINVYGVAGKVGYRVDLDAVESDLIDGEDLGVIGASGTLAGQTYQTNLQVKRTSTISTDPFVEFYMKSKNKNNVWLRAITPTEGASQINSRLQVGYNQFEPNAANPYYLTVGGAVEINNLADRNAHLFLKSQGVGIAASAYIKAVDSADAELWWIGNGWESNNDVAIYNNVADAYTKFRFPGGVDAFKVNGTEAVFAVPVSATNLSGTNTGDQTLSGLGGIGGSGTVGYIPKFTASGTIGNSLIYDNGTNVGIGTTSPSYKLHIKETSANAKMYINGENASNTASLIIGRDARNWEIKTDTAANYYRYSINYIGTDAPVSNIMTILPTGNVGIGTASPLGRLQINKAQTATTAYTDPFIRLAPSSTINGTGLTSIALGTSTVDNNGITLSAWRKDTSTAEPYFTIRTHYGSATGSDRLTIDPDGNVGIGTTSPSEELDVAGTIKSSSHVIAGTNVYSGSGLFVFGTSTTDGYYIQKSSTNMNFISGGSTRLTLASDGDVGIGTSAPSEKLDVQGGNIEVNGSGMFPKISLKNTSATSGAIEFGYSSALGYINNTIATHDLAFQTGGVTQFFIDGSSNRVGIGTSSPSQKLEVIGSILANGGELIATTTNNARIKLNQSAAASANARSWDLTTNTPAWGTLAFRVANNNSTEASAGSTTPMVITYDGKVGIATSAPGYPLDVNGTTRVTGTLHVGNSTSKVAKVEITDNSYTDYFLAKSRTDNGQIIGFRSIEGGSLELDVFSSLHTIFNNNGIVSKDFILDGTAVAAAEVPALNQTIMNQQAEIQTLKAALIQANAQIDLIRTHLGI